MLQNTPDMIPERISILEYAVEILKTIKDRNDTAKKSIKRIQRKILNLKRKL